jgi:hypothetical protein
MPSQARAEQRDVTMYHFSRQIVPVGEELRAKDGPHLPPMIEQMLEATRPRGKIGRAEAVFVVAIPDFTRFGLPFDQGYIHIVEAIGQVDKHDVSWIGTLQLRHHPSKDPMLKKFSLSNSSLSDDELCLSYWEGRAGKSPAWEYLARRATVLELYWAHPVEKRLTEGGWQRPV